MSVRGSRGRFGRSNMRRNIFEVSMGIFIAVAFSITGCGGGGNSGGGGSQTVGNATISGKVAVLGSNVNLTGATVTAYVQPVSPPNASPQYAGTGEISGLGQLNSLGFYEHSYTINNLAAGSYYYITLNIPTVVNHHADPVISPYCMSFLGTLTLVKAPEQSIDFSCSSGLLFNSCSSGGNQCP